MTRIFTTLLVALALLPATPVTSAAQPVVVGGVLGRAESRQLRERAEDSEPRAGLVAGAWLEIETPTRLVHVLAEGVYVRRGGTFPLGGPGGLSGNVDSDYLALTVAPSLHVALGPMAAYAYGGPTLEMPLRTRTVTELGNAYANPSDQGLSVTAGAGLEARASRWVVRGEVRIVEGLTSAYSGSVGDFRHRSTEILVRVGRGATANIPGGR
ncbi:MAG: hypothetical protein Q8N53_00480 [Longimicrobiales bacterium]|nr:hypothetical protein [Longimicrobiales bacterium]